MASTWPYRIAVIVLTIAVMIVLEVLYQYSVKNNGITNISINSYDLNGWLYVSTIIVAGTALAYGALDSTARLLHPFQELRRGKMQFQELLCEPLGHATILATVHSLRKRYFALAVILLTSLLSPALTIVTSGLFTTTTVSYQSTEALHIQSWLLVEDGGRADCNSESRIVSDAIAFNNLSYPRWTHDDLVFPEISLNTSATNSSLSSATSLTARLPSVRSRMNCQVQGFYTAANTSVRYSDGDKTWEMTIAAPPGCVTNEAAHNETAPGTMQLGGTFTSGGTGYMGNMATQYFINATCKNHVYLGGRILPKDPGSVAARMSLFAGSGVVRRLVGGEGGFERAFEGEVVRLGWCGRGRGSGLMLGVLGAAGDFLLVCSLVPVTFRLSKLDTPVRCARRRTLCSDRIYGKIPSSQSEPPHAVPTRSVRIPY